MNDLYIPLIAARAYVCKQQQSYELLLIMISYRECLLLGSGFILPRITVADVKTALAPSSTSSADSQQPEIDIQKIYASKKTSELLFSFFILKVCSVPLISENGDKFIDFAEKLGVSALMNWVVKHTFFKQFCAGETIEETARFTERLNQQGIGTILDYSVEDQEGSAESFDHVADQIVKTIGLAARNPDKSFSCVKVTGLSNPQLLEKLNTHLSTHLANNSTNKQLDTEILRDPLAFYTSGKSSSLSATEIQETNELVARLDRIFKECHKAGVPILVDAEQTYYQATIHHLAMAFSLKYNVERPLIYNTYQMYLAEGLNVLNSHMELAKQSGFKLGVKVVRGAYMNTERTRASAQNYSDPIQPNITETHNTYFAAMELLLKESKNLGIMFATHNQQSVALGVERIAQLGIDPANRDIQFGQLFGMADFLSLNLVNQNQRVFKYVPYGPVKDVLPYLIRRMQENKGFIGIIVAEGYGSAKMRYNFKKYIRYLWESKSIEPSFTQCHARDHNEAAINLLYGITNAYQLESIVNSCLTVIKQSDHK
eukprot:gene19727-23632_t